MRSLNDDNPSPSLDLSQVNETTRRRLYDITAAVFFSSTATEQAAHVADPDDHRPPDYSADQAGLTVFFALGRWWTTWLMLDEPDDLPEARRRELLRITADPRSPHGVLFHGI
jgi:hypothetical protein